MRKGLVFLFVKEPRAGRAKTRLGRDIGPVRAAMFYRHMMTAVIRRLNRQPGWDLVLAVDSYRASLDRRFHPEVRHVIAQSAGDLGRRMAIAFQAAGLAPAIIVGSDIPDLGPREIKQALRTLGRADVVVGPSGDGGYWLIRRGGRARTTNLFTNVRWSSEHALIDTLANLPANVRVAKLGVMADIDTGRDLQAWRRKSR